MNTHTYRPPQIEVRAECDVRLVDFHVDRMQSRLAKAAARNPEAFEDLHLSVTLLGVRPQKRLHTLQVVVFLGVEAESRGRRLSRVFRGKYSEPIGESALGCFPLVFKPIRLSLTLIQLASIQFRIEDVPPEWVLSALETTLLDVLVSLDQLVGREPEGAALFRGLNSARWIAAFAFAAAGAGWLAFCTSPERAILGGVIFAFAGWLALHSVRPFLLPAKFWLEEPLGRRVLQADEVASVWKMRAVSLLLIVAVAAALYFASLAILTL